ncbi:MAG TPA: glycosyltransferase family A protein [Phycisphaerales bacterium]|nr:glycosyltransferase family A protein [Phycisphaerales bacterium]
MEVSAVIPTFGRARKAAECVRRLARQTLRRSEVLVGIDGGLEDPCEASRVEAALAEAWGEEDRSRLVIVRCPRVGLAAVRNALLARARGSLMVSLNDDVLPQPDLLERHAAAHRGAAAGRPPAVVVGSSPWVVHEPDRLFDRLIRETSMIFFYDRMESALAAGEAGPEHDWGFRHCWGLNFSAPLPVAREIGGFRVYPATYGYEDNEFAFRMAQRFGSPIRYCPAAVAHHDHRMEPHDYLGREYKLGFAAWGFAAESPDCAAAMFGREIRSEQEIAYSREFVERERPLAERIRATFLGLAGLPADAAPEPSCAAGRTMIAALYQQHLLLKRWEWRRGLLDAARGDR